jgi:hypothetical protein
MRPTLVGVYTDKKELVYINPQHVMSIRHVFGTYQEIQLSTGLLYKVDVELAKLLASFAFAVVEPTQ